MKSLITIVLIGATAIAQCSQEITQNSRHSLITENVFNNKSLCKQALLFSGNANNELANKVASYLNVSLAQATVKKFNDGEIQIQVHENVRNKDIFIIQPTCPCEKQSINDNIMELFLLIRTMKRASAASITAVIPY